MPTDQPTNSQAQPQDSVDRNDPKNKLVHDPITGMTYDPVTKQLFIPEMKKEIIDQSSHDKGSTKEGTREEEKKLTLKQKMKLYTTRGINSISQPGSTNGV